ncbi:hypothetical protein JCM16303_002789 [Sporobolomyces ruberrimus]
MWNSLSGSLSSYLNPASGPSTSSDSTNTPSTPQNGPVERVQQPADGLERDDPHTPDHPSQRLSPNSLSASGNQTMAGILAAHPQFSVFRKSTSREGIDELSLKHSRDTSQRSGSVGKDKEAIDGDKMETLATPPASSPRARIDKRNSPSGNSSGSSSFHFSSLEGADLPSLNFGDHSSSGSLVGVSPRASPSLASSLDSSKPPFPSPPADSTSQSNDVTSLSGGVRLIPDSPPASRRSPSLVSSSASSASYHPTASTSRPARTPSRSSSSSSLSRSQSVTRVGQFSPLSLCPSPLIGAPVLPPPPPLPTLSSLTIPEETEEASGPGSRRVLRRTSSILKLPRTPGTGRSVRFTESIIDHGERGDSFDRDGDVEDEEEEEEVGFEREESPSILPGSRQRHAVAVTPRMEEEQTESALDFSAMTSRDSIMTARQGGHSSFLDRLKEVIPSPDVSLVAEEQVFVTRLEEEDLVIETTPEPAIVAQSEAEITLSQTDELSLVSTTTTVHTPGPPTPSQDALEATSIDTSLSTLTIQSLPSQSNTSSTNPMLFDESNPCHYNSISVLASSTLGGGGGGGGGGMREDLVAINTMEVLDEEDEEDSNGSEGILPTTPRAKLEADRQYDVSRTPTSSNRAVPTEAGQEEVESPLRELEVFSSTSPVPSQRTAKHDDGHSQGPESGCGSDAGHLNSTTYPATPSVPLEPELSSSATSTLPLPLVSESTTCDSERSHSQSFYRKFMASRAKLGGSQTAAQEWDRLEKGEKASPKESQNRSSEVLEMEQEQEGASVYYSPGRGEEEDEEEFEEEEEEVERVLVQGGSFYEMASAGAELDEERLEEEGEDASVIDYGGLVRTFLSPIVELSEPETTFESPVEQLVASLKRSHNSRPKPPLVQPTFSSLSRTAVAVQTVPVAPATPSRALRGTSTAPSTPLSTSKIPRPRNPITPSQNPFLLQLAKLPNAPRAAEQQAALIQELFSTQQDQISTSSSQRFLLSSLVTNLQNEVDHKNLMVENLKKQVEEARHEVEEVERIALEWQRREESRSQSTAKVDDPDREAREQRKVAALEETVQLLADELDTRLRENGTGRKRIEGELERTRAELVERSNEVRNTEIRLRHAKASQAQAEEEARVRREREEAAKEEAVENKRQLDLLRARWQAEAEDRDRTTQRLREELLEVKTQHDNGTVGGAQFEERIEKEVARRVEEAKQALERETSIIKHELVLRDEALADLRTQLRSAQDEAHESRGMSQEDRQQAELALSDLQAELSSKNEVIVQLREANGEIQDELDETVVKFEDANIDRDRLVRLLESKEVELAQQQEQCHTAISAMRDLEEAVTRFESEAAVKESQLAKLRKELELQTSMLEKREGVLVEAEKQVSRLRKERGVLEAEKEKAVSFVDKLKRDSADREIRISKLKKRIAELDEDVFGLNIALDAKQQEASHWKRQMSQLKLERTQQSTTVPPSSTARPVPASTIRRSATTASVLAGLNDNGQGTPIAGPKKSILSRRSSRTNLHTQTQTQSQSIEHDLTLPGHEETPSRQPPVQSQTATSSAAGTAIRKSSSSNGGLRLIEFPDVPKGEQDRLNVMASLGIVGGPGGVRQKRRESGSRGGGISKENEPIQEGEGGSRKSSASRSSSSSFRARSEAVSLA